MVLHPAPPSLRQLRLRRHRHLHRHLHCHGHPRRRHHFHASAAGDARLRAPHHPAPPAAQADEVKARLFTMAKGEGKWTKKGSITDDDMKRLIESTDQARQP